ncbi:MAG: FAD-binding oxidoreductase [Cypionkella sp.]|nr:FAD-binding oxidoreductase [Cypionkella sp.]
MALQPADTRFVEILSKGLPHGTLRPVEARDVTESRGRWQGMAGAVARPASTDEVAQIVRACAAARVGIVPIAGGSGLVGGQIMPQGDGPLPLLVSLERMNALRAAYPAENCLVVEAGMILADVQRHAADMGRLFPLSLASEGSCQIGGNLATNAGGTGVLRYGNARDLVLGIEAVLPDGSIMNGLKRLRKDNTGYDLRHLLIGSEGTLGIITAASLRLHPAPASTATALMTVPSPAAALELLALAEGQLAGMISAFELIGQQGLDFLAQTMPDVAQPLAAPQGWLVLMEIGLPSGFGPAEAPLEALFAAAMQAGLTEDGVIAASEAQRAGLWRIRESIPLANRAIGAVSSHDISVPLSSIPDFITAATRALADLGDMRINCFGHVGDGNLHYNVFPAQGRKAADYADKRNEIKVLVHDLVHQMGGSVSAEHGVGRLKTGDLIRYGDGAKIAAMRAIKAALDPAGIMNPGAILRD